MKVATARPLNKVSFGVASGAATLLVTWLVKQYGGVDMPGEVQSALTLVIGYAVSYFVPIAPGEIVPGGLK